MTIRNLFYSKQSPPRRFAFLLGNAAYTHVTPLRNPANDVDAVERELAGLGYKITKRHNRDWVTTWHDLKEFFKTATEDGKCQDIVLYYCGHGVQLEGDNYIVPVDFNPELPVDHFVDHSLGTEELAGLIKVQDIMTRMKVAASTSFIFLDACRNTGGLTGRGLQQIRVKPFSNASPHQQSVLADAGTRSLKAAPGMAKLGPVEDQQAFICFSADPGDVANDSFKNDKGVDSDMSPFSAAVSAHISTRGLDVFDMSQRIARDVRDRTGRKQIPWANSSLEENFAFHPADTRPVWILGALGALTGFIGALLSFNLFDFDDEWHLKIGDLKLHYIRDFPYSLNLLLPFMFGTVLGYGVYRWGRRSWTAAIGTCLIYAFCAAISRFWIAPYGSDIKMLAELKCLKPRDIMEFSSINVRLLLLTAILAAGLAGAASVFSAGPFVRDMAKLTRVSVGALLGAGGALLFLVFLWARAQFNTIMYNSYVCVPNPDPGAWHWLEPFGIIFLFMVWEAALAINVGYAYAKPSNE